MKKMKTMTEGVIWKEILILCNSTDSGESVSAAV